MKPSEPADDAKHEPSAIVIAEGTCNEQPPQEFLIRGNFISKGNAEERNHRAIKEEHVELTLGDARELPYEDESFDKVFAMNVFHFWPEPAKELAQCLHVLKPGGRVLFYCTHHSSWIPGVGSSGLFIAYEPGEVEEILRDAGFRNVESHMTTVDEKKCFVVTGIK